MRKLRILFAIVAVLAVGGWAVWKFYVQKPVESVKDSMADFTTSVQSLFIIAADSIKRSQYIDKVVEIQGIVKEVLPSDSASVVNLTDSIGTDIVICQIFKTDNAAAKTLQPNTSIKVKGRLTGFDIQKVDPNDLLSMTGSSIQMKDCAIIK